MLRAYVLDYLYFVELKAYLCSLCRAIATINSFVCYANTEKITMLRSLRPLARHALPPPENVDTLCISLLKSFLLPGAKFG